MCIFRRHGGLKLIVSEQSPWIYVVFWCGSSPFCVVSLFLCWRNANLAGRFACRRCCRVSFCSVGFSMVCLVCEAKGFILFAHFSTASLRALERDRPQQRKKIQNIAPGSLLRDHPIKLNDTDKISMAPALFALCLVLCCLGCVSFGLLLLCCFCLFVLHWLDVLAR